MILKFTIPEWVFNKTAGPIIGNELATGIQVFQVHTAQVDFFVDMLLKEYFFQSKYWTAAVENYLSLLFVELVRGPEYCSSKLLCQLTEYFDASPRSATLGDFASFIGYSQHHAARLIKQHTGRSFLEVVVSLKMERARNLLIESDATIAEIADDLGYANASGLHKQFYAAYGMTPNTYRKIFKYENGPLRK